MAEALRPMTTAGQISAQGTIYPDIIEVRRSQDRAARRPPSRAITTWIPFPDGVRFDLIEPLDHFFRTRSRAWMALGLPPAHRVPSALPGPGLAIASSVRSTEKLGFSERRRHRARGSTPTTSVCLSRPASATPSIAAGSISRFCPTLDPWASWATSAPTRARSSSCR